MSLESGNVLFWFFKRTILFCEAVLARKSFAALLLTEYGICAKGTISSGSNIPNLKRAVNKRFTAMSISASAISLRSTASFRDWKLLPHSKSKPFFTANAEALAASFVILWYFQISVTAPQSDTM
ncbi:hypothetical protein D3C80_1667150 [compost metagenome]